MLRRGVLLLLVISSLPATLPLVTAYVALPRNMQLSYLPLLHSCLAQRLVHRSVRLRVAR